LNQIKRKNIVVHLFLQIKKRKEEKRECEMMSDVKE